MHVITFANFFWLVFDATCKYFLAGYTMYLRDDNLREEEVFYVTREELPCVTVFTVAILAQGTLLRLGKYAGLFVVVHYELKIRNFVLLF